MGRNPAEKLTSLFDHAIGAAIFPGAAIAVIQGSSIGDSSFYGCYGYTDYETLCPVSLRTVYDLASLTKPLATTLAILSLISDGTINFDDTLSSLLERSVPAEKETISLSHLLNHSAGFVPHHPFFHDLVRMNQADRGRWLLETIVQMPIRYPPGQGQRYSDIDFMLLGMIVERKAGQPLSRFAEKRIFTPLGLEKTLFFRPLSDLAWEEDSRGTQSDGSLFAPTERCPWRKKLLHGEVHDDNAWAFGGVAGHAGLFGTIAGVEGIVRFLLDAVAGRAKHPFILTPGIHKAVARQNEKGTFGLGFDTRSASGSSSGQYFSPSSFGHLGYTGTSFWIDPVRDRAIILLSNRVHPSRDNDRIKAFRPLFHDAVVEALTEIQPMSPGVIKI